MPDADDDRWIGEYARLDFEPIAIPARPVRTPSEQLSDARNEEALCQVMFATLRMSRTEMIAKFKECQENFLRCAELLQGQLEYYECFVEGFQAATLRMAIVIARNVQSAEARAGEAAPLAGTGGQ